MRDDILTDLTPTGYFESIDCGRVQILRYPDGAVRVRHECHRPRDNRTLIHAPMLQLDGGHTITSGSPITVTPSILCEDCGMHGFLTNGTWLGC